MAEIAAGRELDVLVAEKVMGWDDYDTDTESWRIGESELGTHWRPVEGARFSRDIAAAWEVVEKLREDGWFFHIDNVGFDALEEGKWRAFVQWFSDDDDNPRDGESHHADADTVPHVICLVALLAVGALPTEAASG